MRRRLIAAACWAVASTAMATDLMQVWQAVSQHDPRHAVAAAQRATASARRDQAVALWRPRASLSSSAGMSSSTTQTEGASFAAPGFGQSNGVSFATSVTAAPAVRLALQARQPLLNGELRAQQKQLELSADAAETQWTSAQQELMMQTAQSYFRVVLAERHLALLERQQRAVDQALSEALDRFAMGTSPVTDTHEARARSRGLAAQVLGAKNRLELALGDLCASTGWPLERLHLQAPAAALSTGAIEPLEQWLRRMEQSNPSLLLRHTQYQVAAEESRKQALSTAPTLDLVAQASRERISGSGSFGGASNAQSQQMIGFAFNMPLYSGGWRDARQEEALRLEEAARAEFDAARMQISQQVRTTWLNLQSGRAQLEALTQSLTASQARLDATELGRQVGHRTTLDLLNAQNDAAAAELAVLQARIDLLLDQLRLDALAGQLGPSSLEAVNASLQR